MAERRVAVFIDAENMPVSLSADIVDEAARHGRLTARRIYGDFSRPALAAWLDAAPRHALTSCQTAGGAIGRNGADIALVIDAMEILCEDGADVFCLATSDGDFTQLAMRIRQRGKTAVGIGRSTASMRFRSACDTFKAVEIVKMSRKPVVAMEVSALRRLEPDLLQKAFAAATSSDGGWVGLPDLMKGFRVCRPTFAVKAYGHSQLSKLLLFSGVELSGNNQQARLKAPALKKVVDNG